MHHVMEIAPRFNGPPDSGNGGYSAGSLAQSLDMNPAEVTLRAPVPLSQALDVVVEPGEYAQLHDGDTLLAEARPANLDDVEPPSPPRAHVAAASAEHGPYYDADGHPFSTCFVCGPDRAPGDGLRIFLGPIEGRELFAATWTPSPDLAGDDGTVRADFIWAALDCPTSAPVANDPADPNFLPVVLGRLAVRIDAPVAAGREHVIAAWKISVDGRKRQAGAALYDGGGSVLAVARALWIELRPQ